VSIFARRRAAALVAGLLLAAPVAAAPIGAGSVAAAAVSPASVHPPVTPGERVAVVGVPGGRQAAVYDQHGHLTFWRRPTSVGRWLRSGASTYPLLPPDFGPARARVAAVDLAGMRTAVFIVHGNFTGDGDADWIAFGNGPHGWGRLAPRAGTLVPTGMGSTDNLTPGLTMHIAAAGGLLETSAQSDVISTGQGPLLPVNRFWRWSGALFTEARDTIVNARSAPDPLSGGVPVAPLAGCANAQSSGVYTARESSTSNPPRMPFSFNAGVSVTVRLATVDSTGRCDFTVPETFGISLPMTTASGIRWITAPVWVLTTAGSLGDIRDNVMVTDLRPRGAAPYFIPRTLAVTGFARVANPRAPATVRATIEGGHLTALAVLAAANPG
jgi:hypothetical protein